MGYPSKQRKNEISYKSDIIEELAEELNLPKKEIEEIINLNIKYIKKSVLEKDYLIINLPNLCKLRFNFHLGMSSSLRTNVKNKSVEKKVEILKEYRKQNKALPLNFKHPLFYRLWKKIKRKRENHMYVNMYKLVKEVEEESNKIIKEITK